MTRPLTRRAAADALVSTLTLSALILPGAASVRASTTPDGEPDGGWQVVDIAPVDVDGSPVSLSPDGAWLAGTASDDQVCIWAVADLAATCNDDVHAVDPDSITWAPDSSAIAFSALAYLYLVDSDVHVLDVDGTLTNVTDDGVDDQLSIGDELSGDPIPVDITPAWTPDGTGIVFSRCLWNSDDGSTDIMTVPRDGGEATLLGRVDRVFAIYTPMHVLRDGAVLYAVGAPDPGDEMTGIWRLDPDGTTTQLIPGDSTTQFPAPSIADVSERDDGYAISGYSYIHASSGDPDFDVAFEWSSAGGGPDPLAPVGKDDRARVQGAAFSPDGGSVVQLTLSPDPSVEVVGPATSTTPLPVRVEDIRRQRARHPVPTWATNDTVLLPATGVNDPLLVTMGPA